MAISTSPLLKNKKKFFKVQVLEFPGMTLTGVPDGWLSEPEPHLFPSRQPPQSSFPKSQPSHLTN
jgi:hypothetical protein